MKNEGSHIAYDTIFVISPKEADLGTSKQANLEN